MTRDQDRLFGLKLLKVLNGFFGRCHRLDPFCFDDSIHGKSYCLGNNGRGLFRSFLRARNNHVEFETHFLDCLCCLGHLGCPFRAQRLLRILIL